MKGNAGRFEGEEEDQQMDRVPSINRWIGWKASRLRDTAADGETWQGDAYGGNDHAPMGPKGREEVAD
ncbi:unnamed protein product [Lampetra fluviatilis]